MKLSHAADLHLRADLGSPEGKHRLEVLAELCAQAEGSDLMLLAGDVFDSFSDARDARLLSQVKGLLDAIRPKPVIVIPGNHEFLNNGGRHPFHPAPDLGSHVRLAVQTPYECFPLGKVDVLAFPFQEGTTTAQLFRGLPPASPGRWRVAALHGTAQDRPQLSMYAYGDEEPGGDCLIRDQDLAAAGLRYSALGHIHRRDEWTLAGGGRASYPGSTSAIRHIETGPRGFNRVDIDERDGRVAVTFVPLQTAACAEEEDFFTVPGEEAAVLEEVRAFLQRLPPQRLPCARISGLGSRALLEEGKRNLEARFQTAFKLPPRVLLDCEDAELAEAGQAALSRDYLAAMKPRLSSAGPEEKRRLARAMVLGWFALSGRKNELDRILGRLTGAQT